MPCAMRIAFDAFAHFRCDIQHRRHSLWTLFSNLLTTGGPLRYAIIIIIFTTSDTATKAKHNTRKFVLNVSERSGRVSTLHANGRSRNPYLKHMSTALRSHKPANTYISFICASHWRFRHTITMMLVTRVDHLYSYNDNYSFTSMYRFCRVSLFMLSHDSA